MAQEPEQRRAQDTVRGIPLGDPPLLAAVKCGDAAAVHRIYKAGGDLFVRAPKTNNSALHLAAAEGRLDVLRALIPGYTASALSVRQNMNIVNVNRDTPLMFACAKGQIAAAAVLLKEGASVDAVNSSRMTPLILAAASGQRACVDLVLRHGAPLEAEDEHGRRALHYAAAAGATGCVESLIAAGADVFARDRRGARPSDTARQEAGHLGEDARNTLRALEMAEARRHEAHAAASAELLSGEEQKILDGASGGGGNASASSKKKSKSKSTSTRKKKVASNPAASIDEVALASISGASTGALGGPGEEGGGDSRQGPTEGPLRPSAEVHAESESVSKSRIREEEEGVALQLHAGWDAFFASNGEISNGGVGGNEGTTGDKSNDDDDEDTSDGKRDDVKESTSTSVAAVGSADDRSSEPMASSASRLPKNDIIPPGFTLHSKHKQKEAQRGGGGVGRDGGKYRGSSGDGGSGGGSGGGRDGGRDGEGGDACSAARSWASITAGVEEKLRAAVAAPGKQLQQRQGQRHEWVGDGRQQWLHNTQAAALTPAPQSEPEPEADSPIWVVEARARLETIHPTAAALEVELQHLLGIGVTQLSYSQLEAAEEVHRELLSRLADARIELVREQERMRAAEVAEIQRLRAALADATASAK